MNSLTLNLVNLLVKSRLEKMGTVLIAFASFFMLSTIAHAQSIKWKDLSFLSGNLLGNAGFEQGEVDWNVNPPAVGEGQFPIPISGVSIVNPGRESSSALRTFSYLKTGGNQKIYPDADSIYYVSAWVKIKAGEQSYTADSNKFCRISLVGIFDVFNQNVTGSLSSTYGVVGQWTRIQAIVNTYEYDEGDFALTYGSVVDPNSGGHYTCDFDRIVVRKIESNPYR